MPDEPDLAGLEAERARLYADLSQVRDFRRGALNAVRRKCGCRAVGRRVKFECLRFWLVSVLEVPDVDLT